MRMQGGWRYRSVILGEGEVEGVLVGPAPPDVWAEGGGEVVMRRWRLQLDDGPLIDVQEATLTVIKPRGLGPHPGPVACSACQGTGSRPTRGRPTMSVCGNCGGEGISYPRDA